MASRPKIRRRRRTKIIATLGPASSTPEVLARLFQAGADIFRVLVERPDVARVLVVVDDFFRVRHGLVLRSPLNGLQVDPLLNHFPER